MCQVLSIKGGEAGLKPWNMIAFLEIMAIKLWPIYPQSLLVAKYFIHGYNLLPGVYHGFWIGDFFFFLRYAMRIHSISGSKR